MLSEALIPGSSMACHTRRRLVSTWLFVLLRVCGVGGGLGEETPVWMSLDELSSIARERHTTAEQHPETEVRMPFADDPTATPAAFGSLLGWAAPTTNVRVF